jgi:hypothetical protein
LIDDQRLAQIDGEAAERVDAAVAFAESSPFPAPESLYDDVYVLDQAVRGAYSVKTTDPEAGPTDPALPDGTDEIPQQITDALLLGEDAS